jgi:hypothetical protein
MQISADTVYSGADERTSMNISAIAPYGQGIEDFSTDTD